MTSPAEDSNQTCELDYRPPRETDSAGIARLLGELGYPAEPDEIPARLDRLARLADTYVLVADHGGEIAGVITARLFASIHVSAPVAWITTLVVSSTFYFRGIGSALVQRAEQWARENGAIRVSVASGLQRDDAHAFYIKNGYERSGIRFSKKFDSLMS